MAVVAARSEADRVRTTVLALRALGGLSALTWLDYDPDADALYLMKMGSELYRLGRK